MIPNGVQFPFIILSRRAQVESDVPGGGSPSTVVELCWQFCLDERFCLLTQWRQFCSGVSVLSEEMEQLVIFC